MPLYEYQCESCNDTVELMQPVSQCVSVGDILPLIECTCGHSLLRRIPSVITTKTDTDFLRGHKQLSDQFNGKDQYLPGAAKTVKKLTGKSLSSNDVYFPMLARYPNDHEAFVPHDNPRDYIRKLLKSRGNSCSGEINLQRNEHQAAISNPPAPRVRLGEDIIQANVEEIAKQDPEYVKNNYPKVRQEVIDKHGAPADKLTHDSETKEATISH